MFAYETIDSDEKLEKLLSGWEKDGADTIAMDFECEFNLHVYGEHLCLVQIYDKEKFYAVDPFLISDGMMRKLFRSDVEKIFFACHSDATLIKKLYDTDITNVFDVRVLAMLLGYEFNYAKLVEQYLHITEDENLKKKNQKTNWMKRPLKPEQMEYALGDVAYLFELKKLLIEDIRKAGLEKQAESEMKVCARVGEIKPPYRSIGNWKRMGYEQKIILKHLFFARDGIAKYRNVPAFRVLDKHILEYLSREIRGEAEVREQIRTSRGVDEHLFRALMKGYQKAQDELTSRARSL